MAQDLLIELQDISKVFYTEELETRALNSIHLDIRSGEYVAISGHRAVENQPCSH